MDINQETEVIKKELAELIIKHLRENKLTPEKAKQLANDFLSKLPLEDQKDLLKKLEELGGNYEEAREVYIDELAKAENEKTQQALTLMRGHIEKGNIDEAVNTAKSLNSGG
ncbi:MAG: hypothetical protein AAB531_05755 [Patescibacteria group bacterium]